MMELSPVVITAYRALNKITYVRIKRPALGLKMESEVILEVMVRMFLN